eukprot:jgi/Chlat1/9136/Chrsp97S08434
MNHGMSNAVAAAAPSPVSAKHGARAPAQPVDSNAVARRLQQELAALMMSGDAGISAFPEGDSILAWSGRVAGVAGTPYEGLTYKVSLRFPSEYPYKAPVVRFETSCFHPNVDAHGNVCLDILKEQWSAVYNVRTVLLSLQALLGEPNNDSPLNGHAAALWSNQQEFRALVHKKYREAEQPNSKQ